MHYTNTKTSEISQIFGNSLNRTIETLSENKKNMFIWHQTKMFNILFKHHTRFENTPVYNTGLTVLKQYFGCVEHSNWLYCNKDFVVICCAPSTHIVCRLYVCGNKVEVQCAPLLYIVLPSFHAMLLPAIAIQVAVFHFASFPLQTAFSYSVIADLHANDILGIINFCRTSFWAGMVM